MPKFAIAALLAAETALLAGCGIAFDYDGLRQTEMSGDGFQPALARAYRDFALSEADAMYDWPDAAHFGAKALAAAAGVAVAPEALSAWRLPADKKAPLREGRTRLMGVLALGGAQKFPAAAAKAQANFDCWIEQQEENWQREDIRRCRSGFLAALTRLEGELLISPAALEKLWPRPVAGGGRVATAGRGTTAFIMHFAFDRRTIVEDDFEMLDAIAAAAQSGAGLSVVLAGHADRAGPASYNHELSRDRALAVRDALIGRGVRAARISALAFGERRPRTATPDGAREPRNRRVEIVIGPSPAL